MLNRESILNVIYDSLDELNEIAAEKYSFTHSEQEVLFGRAGKLDSLDLVNLLVIIEEKLENEFEVVITIANERAISEKNSPFSNIDRLASFIKKEVELM